MLKYTLKRLAQSLLTLFIVVTIVFLLLRLMPEEGYFGAKFEKLNEVQKEAMLAKMGLNDPILIQLKNFYVGLLRGDLGTSNIYRPNMPITRILASKLPYSIALGVAAIVLSFFLGIPLGMLMARHKNRFWDKLGTGFIVFVMAVPAAIYYLFLQIYVTGFFKLPMLFDADNPASWILPVVSLSLGGIASSMGGIASYAMWMRRYMVDELNKDYVKLARAKGLTEKQIMRKHVFRNAFVPIVQYLPTSLLYTIIGSIYVESLYSIPGMGGLLVDVIQRQDNTVVQALVLVYTAVGIIGLFLGDVLMMLADPRIQLKTKEGDR